MAKRNKALADRPQTQHNQQIIGRLDSDKAILFVKTCRQFLSDLAKNCDVSIDHYFVPNTSLKDLTLQKIFLQLISSAGNANMLKNVIDFSAHRSVSRKDEILEAIVGVRNLSSKTFSDDVYRLYLERILTVKLDEALQRLRSTKLIKGKGERLWTRWLQSVQDSASYVLQFNSGNDFVKQLSSIDSKFLFAGPISIKRKITGIGFALACDALKELGFTQYIKPDTHINDVFIKLNLAKESHSSLDTQLNVFDAAIQLVQAYNSKQEKGNQITAYELDKLIWLCCAGYFYKEKIRVNEGVRELKTDLIALLQQEILERH